MKKILFFGVVFCFLLSCSNTAERDKKIEAAIRVDLQQRLYKKDNETLDSLTLLNVEPITTSRDIALRIDNKQKTIQHALQNIEGIRNEIHDEQENLKIYAGNAGENADKNAANNSAQQIENLTKEIAMDSLQIAADHKIVDSLKHIQVKSERPVGYYVKVRQVTTGTKLGHYSREHMYLVTQDMQVTNCHQ